LAVSNGWYRHYCYNCAYWIRWVGTAERAFALEVQEIPSDSESARLRAQLLSRSVSLQDLTSYNVVSLMRVTKHDILIYLSGSRGEKQLPSGKYELRAVPMLRPNKRRYVCFFPD
jgi:hypothetical protein